MCYQTFIPLIIIVYDFIQSIIQQVLISTNSSNIFLPLSSYTLRLLIIYYHISSFNHFSQIFVLDFLNRLEFKRLFQRDVLWCHYRTADHFLHFVILLLPLLNLYSCFHVLWDPSAPSLCSSLAALSLLSLKALSSGLCISLLTLVSIFIHSESISQTHHTAQVSNLVFYQLNKHFQFSLPWLF